MRKRNPYASKYTLVAGVATRKGVTFKHQIVVSAETLSQAETIALRKLARRFWFCGIVIEDWSRG